MPLRWSETENIRWKTPLPGQGWSTPVVWGDQIWLTSATDEGKKLWALCVNRETGKLEREALAAAVKDARRQAEIVAEAAGVKIVRIESINVGGNYRPMPRAAAAPQAMRAKAADVPVEPGSLDVSAEVQMSVSFGPG